MEPDDENGGDLAALLKQIAAAAAPADRSAKDGGTEAATATETDRSVKEGGAATEAAAPRDAPPVDVYRWLSDLEAKFRAAESRDREASQTREREGLARSITRLVGEGDVAKLQEALAKLEGHYTARLDEKERAREALQRRLSAVASKTALGEAVAGVEFVSQSAARDALAKLEGRVEVALDGQGDPVVREKGRGRPVAELVAEALASDEFAHFLKPSTRGRGGVGAGHLASPSRTDPGAPPDLVQGIKARIELQRRESQRAGLFTTPGLTRPPAKS